MRKVYSKAEGARHDWSTELFDHVRPLLVKLGFENDPPNEVYVHIEKSLTGGVAYALWAEWDIGFAHLGRIDVTKVSESLRNVLVQPSE